MSRTRILVVDDDPDIRTLVNVVLRKNGFEVETASREEEVYDKITAFQPALILLDVLLSGSDGRVICERLKQDSKTAHLPVIMCSAHPAAGKQDYGADDFLSKPFTEEALIEKIQKQLALAEK